MSYGLLLREGQSYQVSHALIHTYARRRMEVTDEIVGRLATYYDTLARAEREKGLQGYRRLDIERPHLMRVLSGCVEREDWKAVQSLAWALSGTNSFLGMQGYWTDLVVSIKLGLTAAQNLSDRYDEGAFLGNLGNAYRDLGQVDKAIEYLQQALLIFEEIKSPYADTSRRLLAELKEKAK